MKKPKGLLLAISLLVVMLANLALAESDDDGSDGDSGDNGGNHDSSDYHDPIHNHFILGIDDGYNNPWFWGGFLWFKLVGFFRLL